MPLPFLGNSLWGPKPSVSIKLIGICNTQKSASAHCCFTSIQTISFAAALWLAPQSLIALSYTLPGLRGAKNAPFLPTSHSYCSAHCKGYSHFLFYRSELHIPIYFFKNLVQFSCLNISIQMSVTGSGQPKLSHFQQTFNLVRSNSNSHLIRQSFVSA